MRSAGHSYAVVGAVVAALSVAAAAAAPILGRLVDRVGQARVLIPLSFLFPLSLGLLVLFANRDASALLLVVLAAATGSTLPPIGACIRTIWPSMLPAAGLRETAYALEAWLQEFAFVLGPVLVGGIAALTSASVAMLVAGVLGLVGTLWFSLTPPVQAAHGHRGAGTHTRRGALGSPGRAHGDLRLHRARLRVRCRRGDHAGVRGGARDARRRAGSRSPASPPAR